MVMVRVLSCFFLLVMVFIRFWRVVLGLVVVLVMVGIVLG